MGEESEAKRSDHVDNVGSSTGSVERDATPIPFSLLPDSAEVGADGALMIGGCSVVELAAEHGTPLFIYDEEHLRSRALSLIHISEPTRPY